MAKEFEIKNKEMINNAIIKRGKELSSNIYKNSKFIILPAYSLNELQKESTQQNNCVRTYA